MGIRFKVNVSAHPLAIMVVQQYEKYLMYTIARIIYINSSCKHPNDKFYPQLNVEYLSAVSASKSPQYCTQGNAPPEGQK